MRLNWSRKALNNRLKIFRHIGQDNPDAAKRMDTLFVTAAKGLLLFPFKGKIGRVIATRELVVHPSYILVYAVDNDCVLIVDVLHAAQQYLPENFMPLAGS